MIRVCISLVCGFRGASQRDSENAKCRRQRRMNAELSPQRRSENEGPKGEEEQLIVDSFEEEGRLREKSHSAL